MNTRLDARGRRSIVLMGLVVLALFASGIGLLAVAVPGQYAIDQGNGPSVFGWATGLLAITLGMRHAFDADHIAAIDSATRKLASEGKQAMSVGFFFSLGHSTIVFLLAIIVGLGAAAVNAQVHDDRSMLHQITGIIGPTISGVFLVVIAIINILVTVAVVRVFHRMRDGEFNETELDTQLSKRGLLNRIFGRLADRIDASWKIYPVGALFGLGLDTATEVTLLVLSATAGLGGLPWWAVLSLPLLFAAGMCLFDSIDGILMNLAHSWAFLTPARKVYYNVVITVMSVVAALVIGGAQLYSVFAENLGWTSPLLIWFTSLEYLGYALVGAVVATWLIAMVVWRVGRFDEKLTPQMTIASRTALVAFVPPAPACDTRPDASTT